MSDGEIEPYDDVELVRRLREGEDTAFRCFLSRYGDALHSLAERRLGADMRRRLGPEDVVQSVCRTFFRRASLGEFDLPDAISLWRLLCAMTVTKIRMKRRFHTQQQRDVGLEQHLDSVAGESSNVPQLQETGNTPEEIAALTAFLVSEGGAFVNGQMINCNGGAET